MQRNIFTINTATEQVKHYPQVGTSLHSRMIFGCLPASLFTPCAKEWKSRGIMCHTSHRVKTERRLRVEKPEQIGQTKLTQIRYIYVRLLWAQVLVCKTYCWYPSTSWVWFTDKLCTRVNSKEQPLCCSCVSCI